MVGAAELETASLCRSVSLCASVFKRKAFILTSAELNLSPACGDVEV